MLWSLAATPSLMAGMSRSGLSLEIEGGSPLGTKHEVAKPQNRSAVRRRRDIASCSIFIVSAGKYWCALRRMIPGGSGVAPAARADAVAANSKRR